MGKKDDIAEGMAGLFYHAANISCYSEEELNAMCKRVPMTEEIFEECIKTALSIYDFENIRYLAKKYPEFAAKSNVLNNQK